MSDLIDGYWMPREISLKKMDRAGCGNGVVEEEAHRTGDDKREEGWHGFHAGAADLAGVYHSDWYREADVSEECDLAKVVVLREVAADSERDLNVQAGIEGVEVEVVDFVVNGGGPAEHVVREIFGHDEEQRRNECKEMRFARFAFAPKGLDSRDGEAGEAGEGKPADDRGPEMLDAEVDECEDGGAEHD